MITMYGIKNCDTVRKARRWLDKHAIEYHFHDYRADGLARDWLEARIEELGWEALVNRRGTTWRKLPESVRAGMDRDSALRVMLEQPALIKRPLLEVDGRHLVGFDADTWQAALSGRGR